MLLILANAQDQRGTALRQIWDNAGAALATPGDLSHAGWSFDPAAPGTGYAVIEHHRVPSKDIEGICVLLPAVLESDLPHIAPGDRGYVAAEMTAFLCAWLTGLPCPKANQPFPYCLCGPNWRTERWIHLAARLGLPTRGAVRSVGRPEPAPDVGAATETVVVVGDQVFGQVDRTAAGWATLMADAAGVRLLNVQIGNDADGTFVVGADVWIDVNMPGVAAALLGELTGTPI
jgi:hypothetical protein